MFCNTVKLITTYLQINPKTEYTLQLSAKTCVQMDNIFLEIFRVVVFADSVQQSVVFYEDNYLIVRFAKY
jgi:hypothetical protein